MVAILHYTRADDIIQETLLKTVVVTMAIPRKSLTIESTAVLKDWPGWLNGVHLSLLELDHPLVAYGFLRVCSERLAAIGHIRALE